MFIGQQNLHKKPSHTNTYSHTYTPAHTHIILAWVPITEGVCFIIDVVVIVELSEP